MASRVFGLIARRAAAGAPRKRSYHQKSRLTSVAQMSCKLRDEFEDISASYRCLDIGTTINVSKPVEKKGVTLTSDQPVGTFYELNSELGGGAFGTVFAARCRQTDAEVAVKTMPKKVNPYGAREVEMMSRVRHPNVAKLLGAFEDEEAYHVVMPRYEGEDLFDLVTLRGVLNERKAFSMAREMLGALEAVHRAGMAHLDVKPENFMHRDCGSVVLIDFGSAEPFYYKPYAEASGDYEPGYDDPLRSLDRLVGSANYLPPEVANGSDSRFSSRSDVWGVGLVLHVLLKGELPYSIKSDLPVFEDLRTSLDEIVELSAEGRDILKQMCSLDPSDRPSPTEASEMISNYLHSRLDDSFVI